MIRKNADREIAEIDLYEIMHQEEPDLDAIEEQIREIADLEAEMKYAWIKLWIGAKSVLTEEQRATFKKLLKDKKPQMMGGKKAKPGKPGTKPGPGGHSERRK